MTKTFLGKNIPEGVLGIVYLCDYNRKEETIRVVKEVMFAKAMHAMDFYANTPNPESHVAIGSTRDRLLSAVETLNKLLKDAVYLKDLKEYL